METQPNSTDYEYFRNRDDAWRLEIDICRHFENQDGGFRFLENMERLRNTTEYMHINLKMSTENGLIFISRVALIGFAILMITSYKYRVGWGKSSTLVEN